MAVPAYVGGDKQTNASALNLTMDLTAAGAGTGDFMIAFKLMVVIYILSTMFDLTMTYVHFHLTPDHFFMYEFSYIIERTFA